MVEDRKIFFWFLLCEFRGWHVLNSGGLLSALAVLLWLETKVVD